MTGQIAIGVVQLHKRGGTTPVPEKHREWERDLLEMPKNGSMKVDLEDKAFIWYIRRHHRGMFQVRSIVEGTLNKPALSGDKFYYRIWWAK